jgi:phosphoserine phosphatase
MTVLLLQGAALNEGAARELADLTGGSLEQRAGHLRIGAAKAVGHQQLATLRARYPFDINPLPADFEPGAVRLLISDMDSTMINIECMDEIADFLGIKPQVAEITGAAMRGDIDFETSLRRRVALIKGVGMDVLQRVYDERLRLNPGAEALIAGLRERNIRIALVSGGFTFFTDRLRERLALDYTLANEFDFDADGRISGEVPGAIVGAQAKADFLSRLCTELGIRQQQAIAAGDGANDLPMLRLAGLSVAFRSKPAVQAEADVVLNHAGLDAILAFLE